MTRTVYPPGHATRFNTFGSWMRYVKRERRRTTLKIRALETDEKDEYRMERLVREARWLVFHSEHYRKYRKR